MDIDTVELRKFLLEKLSDQEFNAFCFDYFRDAYHDFANTMSRGQKIQELLAYCERHGKKPDLLLALQREYPNRFRQWFHTTPETPSLPPSFTRNPRQIFISHAHQDADFAHKLTHDLQQNGWETWIAPDNIRPGEKWGEAIDRGLEESGILVLLITKAAIHSRWVRDETYVAIEMEKKGEIRFIPLLLQSVKSPGSWRVYQHIPFTRNYQNGLAQLLAELEKRPYQLPPPKPPIEQKLLELFTQIPIKVWGGVGIIIGVILIAWLFSLFGGGGGETTREPEATQALTEIAAVATVNPTNTYQPTLTPTPTPTISPTVIPTLTYTPTLSAPMPTPSVVVTTPTLAVALTPTSTFTMVAVVSIDRVGFREGPGSCFGLIRELNSGEEVFLLTRNDEDSTWVHVRSLANNKEEEGWVAAYLLNFVTPEALPTAVNIPSECPTSIVPSNTPTTPLTLSPPPVTPLPRTNTPTTPPTNTPTMPLTNTPIILTAPPQE